jgi:hypothetical protein
MVQHGGLRQPRQDAADVRSPTRGRFRSRIMIRSCGHAVPSYSPAGCTGNPSHSAFWAYLCRSEKVTDGARTRALRSHNPPTPVSGRCRMLQNRLI